MTPLTLTRPSGQTREFLAAPISSHNTYIYTHRIFSASYLYPESIAASILEYRTIQGRTYHSDRHAADYFTPNDEQQLQSVDITHHYLTILLDNKLFLAPISPYVQTVLDVGTGSGIWAMQVSYPPILSPFY